MLPKAQRSLKPEAVALGAFGLIVALACLLISAQLIGRQIRLRADERAVLRALGATPGQTWADDLIGIFGSVVAGAVVAVVVAYSLSPLAPLGPVRPVYPDRGLNFDVTVLGLGHAGPGGRPGRPSRGAELAGRPAPFVAARRALAPEQPSRLLAAGAAAGLPVAALTGVRFALVPGSGRTSVPVRSAVLGAVMAVVVLVATVTFGASLSSLVSHPALYGWNWDYVLAAGGDLPGTKVTALLDHDPYVSAWSGIYTATLRVNGQEVPVLGEAPGGPGGAPTSVGPWCPGRRPGGPGLPYAGPAARARGRHGRRELGGGADGAPAGRGYGDFAGAGGSASGGLELEMGVGAILSDQLIPAFDRNSFNTPLPGPEGALVRLRPGAGAAGYRSLQKIAQETTNPENFGVSVLGVLKPAEILNYRSLGDTPAYLGAGLAAGAVTALALTLLASVRRRGARPGPAEDPRLH